MRVTLRTVEAWVLAAAPLLLIVSLVGDLLVTADSTLSTAIDFHVYRDAAPNLLTGHLYDYRWGKPGDSFPLPFLYPPFAALPFVAAAQVPELVARWLWHAVSVLSVWWLVHSGFRILVRDRGLDWDGRWRRRVLVCTAAVLWIEPVRLTLAYGQVNLGLAAILLGGIVAANDVLAGSAVGVTAGTKLTPAIAGVYLLATKRFRAAIWSIVIFLGTVGIGFLVGPAQSLTFWWGQAHGAATKVPIGTVMNQSLRGAISRTIGADVGFGAPWLLAALLVVAVSGLALWRTVRAGDRLGGIIAVEFLGLQLSPISWNHHWVWMVPALAWLVYGFGSDVARWLVAARVGVFVLWLGVTGGWLVMGILLPTQPDLWSFTHPGYVTALAWAYPVCGLLTTALIATARRPQPTPPSTPASVVRTEPALSAS